MMQSVPRYRRRIILALTVLAIAAIFSASSAFAEEKESWHPPPPMPDDFDWIQMTSGEWLKGEIVSMYEDVLEFDSDEFDLQSVDWEDVQQIRSAQTVQIAIIVTTAAIWNPG